MGVFAFPGVHVDAPQTDRAAGVVCEAEPSPDALPLSRKRVGNDDVEDLLQISAGRYDDKIKLFRPDGVPDPWYTGDFEETYKLVTAGCRDWLQWIKDRQ